MTTSARLTLVAAILCATPTFAQDEEGRAVLLLHKKIFPTEGFSVNQPINVTLTVYNKGPGNAYSLVVKDDNWKQDKFRIIYGGNNFTLDYTFAIYALQEPLSQVFFVLMNHRLPPGRDIKYDLGVW